MRGSSLPLRLMCQLGRGGGKYSQQMELDVGEDKKAKEGGNETNYSFQLKINQYSRLDGQCKHISVCVRSHMRQKCSNTKFCFSVI